jgi:acetolactate synthase-1/2/3 large subunit
MRTADAIFQVIKDAGIDTVFMVAGGGAMHIVDALGRSGLNYVPCMSEQGAGYAAIGYAQISGKPGCVLVTSGPGVTNAVTPCAAAWVDSVPVLFISGQANSKTLAHGQRTRGQQEIGTMEIVRDITRYSVEPTKGDIAVPWLASALKLIQEGRPGPCWMSVPLDVQAEEI